MKFEIKYSKSEYQLNKVLQIDLKLCIAYELLWIRKLECTDIDHLKRWFDMEIIVVVDKKLIPSQDSSDFVPLVTMNKNGSGFSSLNLLGWNSDESE